MPPRRREKPRDEGPIYLTPEGVRRLEERLTHLKHALPARIAETARTAAYGDRSDNAEYRTAKGILRRTHYEIFEIEDQLKRVVVISKNALGIVAIGSIVVIALNDGTERTFEILGPAESDPAHGRISYLSPLGAALMGHAAGDEVTVQTGNGARTYRIVEVR